MHRVIGRRRRAKKVLLVLLLAISMVGAQVALPGVAMSAAAQAKGTPTINTTPSPGGPVGTSISDAATVSGGAGPTAPETPPPTPPPSTTTTTTFPSQPGLPSTGALSPLVPTGTVTFELFPPSDPTCIGKPVFTDPKVPLSSSGTATSGSFPSNAVGTWNWVATYNGDANNNPVSTACGDEPVAITAGLDTTKTLSTADGADVPPGGQVNAGAVLVYTITVTNSGTSPATTTLSETVPDGTTYGPASTAEVWTGCTTGAAAGTTCTRDVTVAPGASTSVTFTVTVTNPLTRGVTAIANQVTSSTGSCSSCSTSNTVADRLYWTNRTNTAEPVGSIAVSNLDGSHPTVLIPNQVTPEGLALSNGHIYWGLRDLGQIWQANLDGSNPTQILGAQDCPTTVPTCLQAPFGVAADGTYVYWASNTASVIMRANLSNPAGTVTLLVSGLPDVNGPQGVAVDSTHIYWANTGCGTGCGSGTAAAPASIWRANLDGTAPTELVVPTAPACNPPAGNCPWPAGVAVNSTDLYWSLYIGGQIQHGPLSSPAPGTALPIPFQAHPTYIALSPSDVYWNEQAANNVVSFSLTGRTYTVLVTPADCPAGMDCVDAPTGIAVGPP